jgi:AcrR family transcriptional regulator
MGRPRSFNRDTALEKAMRLFWERGYEHTSITDLTHELGISAPSLYAAFGDKRTLFEEAVARYEANPASVVTAGTGGRTSREVLQMMLDRACEEYASGAHPRGCLVNSAPELADNRDRNRRIVADQLRRMESDTGSSDDAETLAAFIQVLLVGLSSYARDGADEVQLRRVAELAMRVTTGQAVDVSETSAP